MWVAAAVASVVFAKGTFAHRGPGGGDGENGRFAKRGDLLLCRRGYFVFESIPTYSKLELIQLLWNSVVICSLRILGMLGAFLLRARKKPFA